MKSKYMIIIASLGLVASSFGAITISTQFGVANSVSNTPVPDGTLWALIVDNGNNVLPGGMATNSSISASITEGVLADFSTLSLSLGTVIGGDTVFALGGFNGSSTLSIAGTTADVVEATLGTLGLVSGRAYGFYYFPGKTFTTQGATYSGFGEVGGVNTLLNDAGAFTDGMIIPNDGFTVTQGASTPGDLGGSITQGAFTAVPIPEPSAALLGALGALGLLRRRRN